MPRITSSTMPMFSLSGLQFPDDAGDFSTSSTSPVISRRANWRRKPPFCAD